LQCCGCVHDRIFGHTRDNLLQRCDIFAALEKRFGVVLRNSNLIGHLLGGTRPIGICGCLVRQVGEDLVHNFAARKASGQRPFDVRNGLCFRRIGRRITHHIGNKLRRKVFVAHESGVDIRELALRGEDLNDLLCAHPRCDGVIELIHVRGTRGGLESHCEETIHLGLRSGCPKCWIRCHSNSPVSNRHVN